MEFINGTIEVLHTNEGFHWEPVIQTVIPIIVAFIGFWGILFQQNEQKKDTLKSKLHAEIEEKLELMSNAIIEPLNIPNNLSFIFSMKRAGVVPQPYGYTPNDFIKLNSVASDSAIKLIKTIEKYEIVQPEIKIFQIALNVYLYDLTQANSALFSELCRLLSQPITQQIPTQQQMELIERLYEPYKKALMDLGSVVFDFRIEIQNTLLGHLFRRKLQPRKPIDPNSIVITATPKSVAKLEKFFREETNWGRNQLETETRVRNQFARNVI